MGGLALSVVVPVYNGAGTLERCVSSLVLPGHKGEYEVILVDDGSDDGSGALCDQLASEMPGTVVALHQSNAGVSSARNRGMSSARGKYLAFVDADDYVVDGSLALMLDACAGGCDFVLFDYIREADGVRSVVRPSIAPNDIERARRLMLTCESNSPWSRLYRRALSKGVEFPLGQGLGEDLVFNLRFLERAETSSYVAKPAYVYVENPESRMTSGASPSDARDYARMLDALVKFCGACNLGDEGLTEARSSMRRVLANYAARLHRQGVADPDIRAAIGGIDGINEVVAAPANSFKDRFRRYVLDRRAYGLASAILKGK